MSLVHTYERVTIIRIRSEVYADGSLVQQIGIDSTHADRNEILAALSRAQFIVLQDGGNLHDDGTLLVDGVPEFEVEEG